MMWGGGGVGLSQYGHDAIHGHDGDVLRTVVLRTVVVRQGPVWIVIWSGVVGGSG